MENQTTDSTKFKAIRWMVAAFVVAIAAFFIFGGLARPFALAPMSRFAFVVVSTIAFTTLFGKYSAAKSSKDEAVEKLLEMASAVSEAESRARREASRAETAEAAAHQEGIRASAAEASLGGASEHIRDLQDYLNRLEKRFMARRTAGMKRLDRLRLFVARKANTDALPDAELVGAVEPPRPPSSLVAEEVVEEVWEDF